MNNRRLNSPRLPKDYVEAISTEKLVHYLESHGWKRTAVIEENEVVVYRHPSAPKADILTPLTHKYADYLHRIADAVFTVAGVEHRPFWEVYMDMAGRYYVGPRTYSTAPQTNGTTNGATKVPDSAPAKTT
jgi:hypothetical protein